MNKKSLLLNFNYEPLSLISERKSIKLLINDKVEVLANWKDKFTHSSGYIDFPAIIKMKYLINVKHYNNINFSRKLVILRDNNTCQFCGINLKLSEITIDHILPKVLGGETSFTNCVVSCFPCNARKGKQTLVESKMTLIKRPKIPSPMLIKNLSINSVDIKSWHPEWFVYIKKH